MLRRMIQVYGRAIDHLDRALLVSTSSLLGIVVLLTAVEIIGRNVFKYSSPEAVDITLSVAILVYLLGYAVLLNRDQDVTMDFFYRRFSPAVRRLLDLATDAGILAFFAILLAKSWRLFELGLNSIHPVFPVPHGVVALPAVIAGAACLLVALRRMLDSLLVLLNGGVERGARATEGHAP